MREKKDLDEFLKGFGLEEGQVAPSLGERGEQGVADPVEVVSHFLVGLLLYLEPAYSVEIRRQDERIWVEVVGGNLSRIIGKDGKTLMALEGLTNTVLSRHFTERYRVIMDAAGYRSRQEKRLRRIVDLAIAQVEQSGLPVPLPPMDAGERRTIHNMVAEHPGYSSESMGEGEERHVVISRLE